MKVFGINIEFVSTRKKRETLIMSEINFNPITIRTSGTGNPIRKFSRALRIARRLKAGSHTWQQAEAWEASLLTYVEDLRFNHKITFPRSIEAADIMLAKMEVGAN